MFVCVYACVNIFRLFARAYILYKDSLICIFFTKFILNQNVLVFMGNVAHKATVTLYINIRSKNFKNKRKKNGLVEALLNCCSMKREKIAHTVYIHCIP